MMWFCWILLSGVGYLCVKNSLSKRESTILRIIYIILFMGLNLILMFIEH